MYQSIKSSLGFTYLLLLILLAACSPYSSDSSPSKLIQRTLYYNGTIIPMNTPMPSTVEALVVEQGKIQFVGSLAQAKAQFKQSTLINLQGRTLLPGFIDPHSHFSMVSNTMGQVDLNPPPVGKVANISQLLGQLKAYKISQKIPDGEWIYGWGYDESQLAEQRHPTKVELDHILPNNPVYIQHSSGHMGVANSLALHAMKVNALTDDPDGGLIGRVKGSQEPNGLVQETAMYPFVGVMLQKLAAKQEEFFNQTQLYYASNGITTAQDGMTDRETMQFFRQQAAAGKLKLDLVSLAGFSELEINLQDSRVQFKDYNNGYKVQGTKIIADGSPQGKTAFFTQPYLTSVEGCHENCRGLPSLSQAALNQLFTLAYKHNNQLFIHANGDASIDRVLTAHRHAVDVLDQAIDRDRRTVIIHSQFVRDDQLQQFKIYKMIPSFFTNHAYFWGDVHLKNLGEERAKALSPMASAAEIGLKFTNHSDATVTPVSPIFSLWTAVNRISRKGVVMGNHEKVSVYQALQAITSHAAYQLFEESTKGTLEVGKVADFVILDKNPLTVDPAELRKINVVQTIKNGSSIYRANYSQ